MAIEPRSFIRNYLTEDQRRIPETTAPKRKVRLEDVKILPSLGAFGSLLDSSRSLYKSITGNDVVEQAKQAAIGIFEKIKAKRLNAPTSMREATDAELAPLGLSRQEVRSNVSEALVRSEEDVMRRKAQGMVAEFDLYNPTPTEKIGAFITAPVRWTIGSLARFTVGAIGAITDTDIKYTPINKLNEYFWGPQELTSIGRGEDLYSLADNTVKTKLQSVGVKEGVADRLGLGSALILGAILENPFLGPSKKGLAEATEKALRGYIETNLVRGTASDELLERITKESTIISRLPAREREVAGQRFLAEIEAEQFAKKSVQRAKNELLAIRKQYVRNAVETDEAVFKNISEYEQKRIAAQEEVSSLKNQGLWKHEYASAIRNTPDWRKEGAIADWMRSGSLMTRDLPNGRKMYTLVSSEDVPIYKAGGWNQTGQTVDTMASQAGFDDPSDYLDFVLKMDDKLAALPEKDPIRLAHNYLLKNDPTYANINTQIDTAKQQLLDLERQGIAAPSLNATTPEGFNAREAAQAFGDVADEPMRSEAIRISSDAKQISDVTKPPKAKPTDELYAANRVLNADRKQNVADAMERVKTTSYEKGKDMISAITERMENIDPTIKNRFRKMLQDSMLQTQKDGKVAHELFQSVSKTSKQDIADIGYAMINGDTEALRVLSERNGFSETVTNVRTMLDDVYKRAQDVGYEFGYEQGYFPRMIKDKEGFIKYMEGDARYGDLIREAIVQEEKISGKLTVEKKAELINSLIRGYKRSGIALAKTGNMKDRAIDVVTPEMMKFYMDPFESLAAYIRKTNELIEGKKFFGGGTGVKAAVVDEAASPIAKAKASGQSFDEWVKTQGEPVYHGTNAEFTEFDPSRIGARDSGFFGKGFYFAQSRGEAESYGKNVMEAYLDLRNPFDFSSFGYADFKGYGIEDGYRLSKMSDVVPAIKEKMTVEIADEIPTEANDFKRYVREIKFGDYDEMVKKEALSKNTSHYFDEKSGVHYYTYKDIYGKESDFKFHNKKEIPNDLLDYVLFNEKYKVDTGTNYLYGVEKEIADNLGDDFTNKLKELGYDGAIQSPDGDEYVAFYPEQIKTRSQLKAEWDKVADAPVVNPTENITDSIGMYTLRLMEEGKITPSQELELTKILDAYFNQKGPGELVGLIRDGSYLMTIGNPISAISNLADLWYSFYKAGSRPDAALSGIIQSATKNSVATLEELGFENTLRELSAPSGLSKLLEKTMRAVGFDKLDRLGKETAINTLWNKWKILSNGSLSDQSKVRETMFRWLQDEKLVDKAIADIKVGNVSDDMKFVLFNEISDYAPMTLGEMPVDYLRGGNVRLLYQLKSYTLKQLEVVRREALKDIFSKDNKARGFKNLMVLSSFFLLANASVDELKALILGRPLSVEDGEMQEQVIKDRLVDNMLKLFGMSKYSTYKLRDADLTGFLTSYFAPPALGLIETAVKDAQKLMDSPDLSTDILQINSISNIPIGGKLFYWWTGHGAEKSADQKEENLISQTTKEFLKLKESGDKDGAKDLFESVVEANPEMKDKLFTNIENEVLDLTRQETNLKNRTVAERADIIYRTLKTMDSKEEKRAYLENLQKKKILTKSVLEKLGSLSREEQAQEAAQ